MGNPDESESQSNLQEQVVDSDVGSSPPRTPGKSYGFILAFVGLSCIVVVFQFDATALGVAVPTIAADLGGSTTEALFANISYLLLVVVSTPIWTSVSDVVGRKPLLLLAAVLFFIGSIIFAVAQDMATLIASRVLQGLAGGGINVLAENIVADMTTMKERSFWLGILGIPVAFGNVLGTPLGGVFTELASWRWLGWINLPFIAIGVPLVWFFLHLRSVSSRATITSRLRSLDFLGMVLWSGGVTALIVALSCAGELHPWSSWRTLLPLILGFLILVAFAVYEGYATSPIVPHRIYRPRTAWLTILAAFLQGIVMFCVLQYVPLFYQAVNRLSVITMVVYLLPCSFAGVLLSIAVMVAVEPVGKGYKPFLIVLWPMTTLGVGLLGLLGPSSSEALLIGLPIIVTSGFTALRLLMLPIQASVENIDDTNLAIGQLLSSRLFGGVLGMALSSGVFGTRFASSILPLTPLPGSLTVLDDTSQAISFIPQLRAITDVPSGLLDAVLGVYSGSMHTVFYIVTGLAGLGIVTAIFTENLELRSEELGRQRFEEDNR